MNDFSVNTTSPSSVPVAQPHPAGGFSLSPVAVALPPPSVVTFLPLSINTHKDCGFDGIVWLITTIKYISYSDLFLQLLCLLSIPLKSLFLHLPLLLLSLSPLLSQSLSRLLSLCSLLSLSSSHLLFGQPVQTHTHTHDSKQQMSISTLFTDQLRLMHHVQSSPLLLFQQLALFLLSFPLLAGQSSVLRENTTRLLRVCGTC